MKKNELRKGILRGRRAAGAELLKTRSELIAKRVLSLEEYDCCDTLLCFISTDIEVDTSAIVQKAFADGKKVAAPRCENYSGIMSFYYISGFDDLETGAFGICEPKSYCKKADSFDKALCIVPGLAFDKKGFRIGFGRGYYDRFLSSFTGVSCGVIFDDNLLCDIPTDEFDRPVMLVVSETKTIYPVR